MKPGYLRIVLFLLSGFVLLTTAGCIIRDDRGRGHDQGYYYHDRSDHPRDRDGDHDDYYRER